MKYEYRSEHAEDIAQAYHRVCHAEREFLENIHPQHRATDIAKTTAEEPPVDEKMTEEPPGPLEFPHLLQGKLQQHLAAREQQALRYRQSNQFPHGFLRCTNPMSAPKSLTINISEHFPFAISSAPATQARPETEKFFPNKFR